MTFRLHHSVILRCPEEKAWAVLSSPDHFARLQEALPSCRNCIVSSRGEPAPLANSAHQLNQPQLLEILQLQDFPSQSIPWPSIDGSPEAVHFTFEESAMAFVEGAQIIAAAQRAVFFHSGVARAGIEEWKLRVLEKIDEEQVRVTETVWGKAPFLIAWGLRLSGLASRVHRQHMELYQNLVSDM